MADDSMRLSARDPRASEAIAKTVQALEDLSRQREKARVTEINKTAEAQRALLAPFQKLIAESPAATRALEELRRHRVEETTPLVHNLSAAAQVRPSAALFSLHMQADLSLAIQPPYDSDWQWGNPDLAVHNRVTGQAIVRGASGHVQRGVDGKVEAAAGIGLVLTTDRAAGVRVRPFINRSWIWGVIAGGPFSSGEASGGLDAAAFLNGEIIAGVRRNEVFSDSRSTAGSDSDTGSIIGPVDDLTLEFNMKPGQVVTVNFGAWVVCDHDNGIGIGGGGGTVNAIVESIVVERFALFFSHFVPGRKINNADSTLAAPAACVFNNKIFLFWKANDSSNSIYFSASPDGVGWQNGQKINNADSTPEGLAACVFAGKLYLFWKANDSSNSIYFTGSSNGLTWPNGRKINGADSTPKALTACVFNNKIFLFWKANDSSNSIYFSVSPDGLAWSNGQKINNADSTPEGLAACVFAGKLYLFWKANDSSNSIYFTASAGGSTWPNGAKINTADSTPNALGACVFSDRLNVVWKANDSSNTIYSSASGDGVAWPNGAPSSDSTPDAVAVCVFQDQMFLFWKANDPSHSIYFSHT